ncbi:MAG: hypothetical protein JNM78_20050 [Cyclobacteriaceae bacterium]|nr:hypothetical protein [Cyclobacteriaceae bacterium]
MIDTEFNLIDKTRYTALDKFKKGENVFFIKQKSSIAILYLKTIHLGDYECTPPIGFEVYIKKKVPHQVVDGKNYYCTFKVPSDDDYNVWAWSYNLNEENLAIDRFNDISNQYKRFTSIDDFNYIPGEGLRDHVRLNPGR